MEPVRDGEEVSWGAVPEQVASSERDATFQDLYGRLSRVDVFSQAFTGAQGDQRLT